MSLSSIFREIIRSFTSWKEIDNPPSWVLNASSKWERNLASHPYGMTKHFIGKNHIYKVHYETIEQGITSEHWFVKKRIK